MAPTVRGWWRLATDLAIANVVWMAAMALSARFTFRTDFDPALCRGLSAPILALELGSRECVSRVLLSGTPCANVSALKLHLTLDVVFILLYGGLLWTVGTLAGTPGHAGRWILKTLVVGACIGDAVENWGLLNVATTITGEGATRDVQGPALVKWALFFLAVGYIAWLWKRSDLVVRPWVRWSLAGLSGLTALVGLAGLFWAPAIALTFVPMGALLLALIVAGYREHPRTAVDGGGDP